MAEQDAWPFVVVEIGDLDAVDFQFLHPSASLPSSMSLNGPGAEVNWITALSATQEECEMTRAVDETYWQ